MLKKKEAKNNSYTWLSYIDIYLEYGERSNGAKIRRDIVTCIYNGIKYKI